MTLEIKTPSNLFEVKRYQDPQAGDIIELIPLDPAMTPSYVGEVLVNGAQVIKFRLEGATLAEALTSWEPALRAVLAEMQRQAVRRALTEGVATNGRAM